MDQMFTWHTDSRFTHAHRQDSFIVDEDNISKRKRNHNYLIGCTEFGHDFREYEYNNSIMELRSIYNIQAKDIANGESALIVTIIK